ncbi:MAG: (2Fe-2S) ferredoxin domain-containing protein [Armatimonadetes bacterium]|nr:(2Fe-2S) ferredoxin domain-containing protein [Armatimonadota bacterium]
MKLSDLQQWRERAVRDVSLRGERRAWRIVISMGTSGIAAGARDVMRAIMDEIERQELECVEVSLTGSLGMDDFEPVLRVEHAGEEVVYGRLTPDAARRIIAEHVRQGRKVERYVIGLPKERE